MISKAVMTGPTDRGATSSRHPKLSGQAPA
jgi:hypothetical protein